MRTLGTLGTDTFNALLRRWRSEGKHIGWPELKRAYELAKEAEEAEEASRILRERRHQCLALEEVRERLALEVAEAEAEERRALEALEERLAEQREEDRGP